MAKILLTGGAGYIGSHLSALASEIGHETVIMIISVTAIQQFLKKLKS